MDDGSNAAGLLVGGEIHIDGYIGDFMPGGITAARVREALAAHGPGDVVVRLNSPGGDYYEGMAIVGVLTGWAGAVTIRVEGLAASAGSAIAMAGAVIEMAPGAMMMVHNPSDLVFGDAEAMRAKAVTLDQLTENAANLYAARTGLDLDQVRALMAAETWMDAGQAVELGFADRVGALADAPAMVAFPYHEFRAAPVRYRTAAMAQDWTVERFGLVRWAGDGAGQTPAAPAIVKGSTMNNGNNGAASGGVQNGQGGAVDPATVAATPPVEGQGGAPVMAAQPGGLTLSAPVDPAEAARQQEADDAARVSAIMERAEMAGMSLADTRPLLAMSREDAFAAIIDHSANMRRQQEAPTGGARGAAMVTDDEGEREITALVGAMMHAVRPRRHALEGPAAQFRGFTLSGLAMHLAGSGQRGAAMSMSRHEQINRGMGVMGVGARMSGAHGVSDFGYITGDAMNRMLREDYLARRRSYQVVARQRQASDFRTLHSVDFSGDMVLVKAPDGGAYKQATVQDGAETFALGEYGRTLNLTYRMIVNDDLGALDKAIDGLGRGAVVMENGVTWGLIRSNASMSGGNLFAASRKNLNQGGAAAFGLAPIGAMRSAMWQQQAAGAKKTDDFLDIAPDLILVPPALETAAMQFVTATTPDSDGNANPWKSTMSVEVIPHLSDAAGGSDTAFYTVATDVPPLEYAVLNGMTEPELAVEMITDPRGVKMVCTHNFGAGATDARGIQKNDGA